MVGTAVAIVSGAAPLASRKAKVNFGGCVVLASKKNGHES